MALRSKSKNSVRLLAFRQITFSCFLWMSPNLILNRYSKARPISVSGDFVPLWVTTLSDRNIPLTSSMISTRYVSSVRYRGERKKIFSRFWNCTGYLIRHFTMHISLFISSIASSRSNRKAFFSLLKLYSIRFEPIYSKGKIAQ